MPGSDIRLASAREAVESLGLLIPECTPTVAALIDPSSGIHPNQVVTDLRKSGQQLSREEKRSLGIRSNAFMSHEALQCLSELGRCRPLTAFSVTLLRAHFSYLRSLRLQESQPHKYAALLYDGTFTDCGACQSLNGTEVDRQNASPFPPEGCSREACAIGYRWKIDFIAELVESERRKKEALKRG